MEVTIDISMYPNREDFLPPIDGFIDKINDIWESTGLPKESKQNIWKK